MDMEEQKETEKIIGTIATEEKKIDDFVSTLNPTPTKPKDNKKIRKTIGYICLILAFLMCIFSFVYRNDMPFLRSSITYSDGCKEIYNFDGKMITPECVNGRWIANQTLKQQQIVTPQLGLGLNLPKEIETNISDEQKQNATTNQTNASKSLLLVDANGINLANEYCKSKGYTVRPLVHTNGTRETLCVSMYGYRCELLSFYKGECNITTPKKVNTSEW